MNTVARATADMNTVARCTLSHTLDLMSTTHNNVIVAALERVHVWTLNNTLSTRTSRPPARARAHTHTHIHTHIALHTVSQYPIVGQYRWP